MIIYVARHGQTDFNIQGRYAGSTDVPLNNAGLQQAENLSEKLADKSFDIIISSPMKRARQTADMIKKHNLHIPIVILNDLAERSVGVFEGLTREEAKVRYPKMYERNCTRQLDDAPANGETIRQFDCRIAKALQEIKNTYADKTILLVCHGFVSRVINRQIKNLSFDEMHNFSLNNCEIAEYVI